MRSLSATVSECSASSWIRASSEGFTLRRSKPTAAERALARSIASPAVTREILPVRTAQVESRPDVALPSERHDEFDQGLPLGGRQLFHALARRFCFAAMPEN